MVQAAVEIYPEAVSIYGDEGSSARYFLYNFRENEVCSFSRAKQFLAQYSPEPFTFSVSSLSDQSVQRIDRNHINQAFFSTFNLAVGLDYQAAYQASKDVAYLKLALQYLFKSIRERNVQAPASLLILLNAIKANEVLLRDPELSLWVNESSWYEASLAGEARKLFEQYEAEKASSTQVKQTSSAAGGLKRSVTSISFQGFPGVPAMKKGRNAGRVRPVSASVLPVMGSPAVTRLRGRERSGSLVRDSDNFKPVVVDFSGKSSSRRDLSIVRLGLTEGVCKEDAGGDWAQHSRLPSTPHQAQYYGKDFSYYQDMAVLLEVFAGALMRTHIGYGQPPVRVLVRDGHCFSLVKRVETVTPPHLDPADQAGLFHAGRTQWVKRALLVDGDDHRGNYLLIRESASGSCVVAIDADECLRVGFLDGYANETKTTVRQITKEEYCQSVSFDRSKNTLVLDMQEQSQKGVVYWRKCFFLDKTEIDVATLTPEDLEKFPELVNANPKQSLYSDRTKPALQSAAKTLQENPVYKAEQYFMQVKFWAAALLNEVVADMVFGDNEEIKHHCLFDLKLQATRQLVAFKASEKFGKFLKKYYQQLGYALLFEVKAAYEESAELRASKRLSESEVLSSVVAGYLSVLRGVDIAFEPSLAGDLQRFKAALSASESPDEIRWCHAKLKDTLIQDTGFYAKTGMKIERRLAKKYSAHLDGRLNKVQVAINKKHDSYIKAVGLNASLNGLVKRFEATNYANVVQYLDPISDQLRGMLSHFEKPNAINWRAHEKPLATLEKKLEQITLAADLAEVYQVAARCASLTETDKTKLLIQLQASNAGLITELMSGSAMHAVAKAVGLIQCYAFTLTRPSSNWVYAAWDTLCLKFKALLGLGGGDSLTAGPKSFREWKAGLHGRLKSAEAESAYETARHYNKKTGLAVGDTVCHQQNCASFFYQACRPIGHPRSDVFDQVRVVPAASAA